MDEMVSRAVKLLDIVAQVIYDKKGYNILALDVRNISSMTDYYIIAEGNVERHLHALYSSLRDVLETVGETPLCVAGIGSGWIVVDYGDVIIHLLLPEIREKYELEQLWPRAKIVDLHIVV